MYIYNTLCVRRIRIAPPNSPSCSPIYTQYIYGCIYMYIYIIYTYIYTNIYCVYIIYTCDTIYVRRTRTAPLSLSSFSPICLRVNIYVYVQYTTCAHYAAEFVELLSALLRRDICIYIYIYTYIYIISI